MFITSSRRVDIELSQARAMDDFRYEEIQDGQSRVLVLHSGNDSDPLQCSLERFSLDLPPEYEALSYTWGDPVRRMANMHMRSKRLKRTSDDAPESGVDRLHRHH